ncbi:MAG TPA: DUF6263 family protein [Armatimonadota bacterium]|jgi:hypothetical protein
MKHGLFAFIAVICLFAAALPLRAVGEVTFTFHPPDAGFSVLQTTKTTRTESMSAGGESGARVIVTTEKARVQYVKTAAGYTRTDTVISTERTVNGVAEADALDNAMIDQPIDIDLDAAGIITAIRGIEAIRRKMLAGMEGAERDSFEQIMTREKIETMIKDEWAATLTPLRGLTKKPGDAWTATTNQILFSSQASPVKFTYSFQQPVTVLKRPCVTVTATGKPELKAVTRDLRKLFEEMDALGLPKDANPKFTVANYAIESSDTIDPALMLPLKSTSLETREYSITLKGRTITFTEQEKITVTSAYESVWRVDGI